MSDPVVIGNTVDSNDGAGVALQVVSGSSATFANNTIGSNQGAGIYVQYSQVAIAIQGNDIEGNGGSGVSISASSSSSFAVNINDNTISQNGGGGVWVAGGTVTIAIQGDDIESNSGAGIDLLEAGATIGGTVPGAGNTISGNGADGIDLPSSLSSGGALIQQNSIEENHGAGVEISTSNNTIGGTAAGAANIIASNIGAGVALDNEDPPTGNLISGNSIHGNGALGIDLDFGGAYSGVPLPNDSGIANNNGQNYPVLTEVGVTEAGTTVTGTLNSTADETFTIEFFSSTTADPSNFGQGQTYLTSTTVTTDGDGNASFTVPLGDSVPIGSIVSATATDSTDDTSEFSQDSIALSTTATTVSSTPNPSVFGQPVTFTATVAAVAPGTGTPTGTVTFFDGATSLGVGTLLSPGVWRISTAALTVGSHPDITADYSGDANFLASDSADFVQTIGKASAGATVTSAPNPSVFGQSVTFTATVTAVAPGAGTPTGTVNFFDGATSLGAGTLISPGDWTFSTSALAVGSHADITADYSGDANFQSVDSPAFSQTVSHATAAATVSSAPNPSIFGQSVTFTATVVAVSPGAGTPTGTVTFFDGATSLGAGTLVSPGVWTYSTAALTAGLHPDITADYSGDGNFLSADSPAFSQNIGQASTTDTVTSVAQPEHLR